MHTEISPLLRYTAERALPVIPGIEAWEGLQKTTGQRVRIQTAEAGTDCGGGLLTAARALAQIDHFGVAGLIDAGELEGDGASCFLITRWPGGKPWGVWASEQGLAATSLQLRLAVAAGLAEALEVVHRTGWVFGGLTPGDIRISDQDQPCIVGTDTLKKVGERGAAEAAPSVYRTDVRSLAELLSPLSATGSRGGPRRIRRVQRRFETILRDARRPDQGLSHPTADTMGEALRALWRRAAAPPPRPWRPLVAGTVVGLAAVMVAVVQGGGGPPAPPDPVLVADTGLRPDLSFPIPDGVRDLAWLPGGDRFVLSDMAGGGRVCRLSDGSSEEFHAYFGVVNDGQPVGRLRMVGESHLVLLAPNWWEGEQSMRVLSLTKPYRFEEWEGMAARDVESHPDIAPRVLIVTEDLVGTHVVDISTRRRISEFPAGSNLDDVGPGGSMLHRARRTEFRISDIDRQQAAVWLRNTELGGISYVGLCAGVFSPDGRWVVASYRSRWMEAEGKDYEHTPEDRHRISSLALYDARTGNLVRSLNGHTAHALSLQFSPDSRLILSAAYDGTTRVWSVRTGAELLRFEHPRHTEHPGEPLARFSPDDEYLLVISADGQRLERWFLEDLLSLRD